MKIFLNGRSGQTQKRIGTIRPYPERMSFWENEITQKQRMKKRQNIPDIGGKRRPDSCKWHESGRLDIMY